MLLGVLGAAAASERRWAVAVALLLPPLAWRWLVDYRRDGVSTEWVPAEAAVLLAVGAAAGSPAAILLLLYARLASKTLDERRGRVVVVMVCYLAAFVGAVLASGARPSDHLVEDLFLASGFPLAAAVMHLLALTLGELGRAHERERVLLEQVHEQRLMEGLRQSEENFRRLFESNPQPMWVHDLATQQFLAVNDAAVAHYGWSREEFLRRHVGDVRVDAAARRRADDESQLRPETSHPETHRVADGGVIQVEITAHGLPFDGRAAVFVLARDVTREQALQSQLRRQAFEDALTRLPNRALLEDRLQQSFLRADRRSGAPPVVLILDLDGFKAVNDTLGHALGDEVIASIGKRLRRVLRPGDTAARLGGDEFAVLVEDVVDISEAVVIAERLVAEIQAPVTVRGHTVAINACVGVARRAPGQNRTQDLLSDADIAMYVAKSRGAGTVTVFAPEHRTALGERMQLQEELTQALASGQLSVVYQPQIDLVSGRLCAVEALVRWEHPVRGVVPPDAFIPLAEQIGLVGAIDAWVLETACRQLRHWIDAGLPALRMAVNISARDLSNPGLVDDVRRALVQSMLDPWHLELELTEGIAVDQADIAVARLQALRDMGVRIAIDDFGTGYSMFSRLRDLPIDRLKIDRSFVSDLVRDDDAAAIVGSTITMGHALGLNLVAEGVESEEVLARLRALGCDGAQGFHICRPVPAAALMGWMLASAASQIVAPVA